MHPRMKVPPPTRDREGFTRTDALCLLAGLLLLGCLLVPAWAAVEPSAQRTQCASNLKSIAKAYQNWAADHAGHYPWQLLRSEGGLHDLPGNGNAWVQQAWLSNYLESPKLLVCPADQVREATTWSRDAEGGFLHPRYRGNAVSYFVGVDVKEEAPRSLLSGDGNLIPAASAQRCDQANITTAASLAPNDSEVAWTKSLHQEQGHLLQSDGSVVFTTSRALRALLPHTEAAHPANHVMLPR